MNHPGKYRLRATLVSLIKALLGLFVLVYLQHTLTAQVNHLDVINGPIVWPARLSGITPIYNYNTFRWALESSESFPNNEFVKVLLLNLRKNKMLNERF